MSEDTVALTPNNQPSASAIKATQLWMDQRAVSLMFLSQVLGSALEAVGTLREPDELDQLHAMAHYHRKQTPAPFPEEADDWR